MKILFLSAYSFPENAASSYLTENRNQAFIEAGFGIVNYTPVPTRGVDDVTRKLYSSQLKHEILYDGEMSVHRFSLMKEMKNPLFRAVRYFFSSIKQLFLGIFAKDAKQCELLFIGSTPPIQGMMAKKIRRIPMVYVVQDIFPDSLVGTGMTHRGSLLWKIGRMIENYTYRNVDKIIVISQDFKRNIMAKGVPEEKIEVIYNWVDQNAVVDIPREQNKLFDMYNLDRSKFYVTYNGNIGLTQNMEMLCDVARELESSHPDIHFVLLGNGAYWDTLVEKLRGLRKEQRVKAPDGTEAITFGNITLLPFQPYEDIAHVFSLGDVSLVISKPGVGANSVPSKTWSIMSAARPVLANFDENELKSIIADNKCGIFTKAGDRESFRDAIVYLFNNRELCKEFGANGRKFVMDNLTKEVGTQKYVDVIKSVVKK